MSSLGIGARLPIFFILAITWALRIPLVGCGGRPDSGVVPEGTVAVQAIPWSTQPDAVGKVAAVADSEEDVAVFGSLGAAVYSSGLPVGSDSAVVGWRAAAVVPALDLPESWLLGVSQLGQVYRMRNRATLEEVTARYGLGGRQVREVVALGPARTALALADRLAVADAQAVEFYALALRGLTAAAGRLAGFDASGVVQLDFTGGPGVAIERLALDGVVAVAYDVSAEQVLLVATAQALYLLQSGALVKAYDAPAGSPIGGLAASGSGVWVALGSELALFRGAQLLHGPADKVPAGGRLVGSPSGDVWVLGGPQLVRLGEKLAGGADENRWRRAMLPIFQRYCRMCHLPGGSANLDLSQYSQWAPRRDRIRQRLIEQVPTPMPPTAVGTLTPAELLAVQRWLGQGL